MFSLKSMTKLEALTVVMFKGHAHLILTWANILLSCQASVNVRGRWMLVAEQLKPMVNISNRVRTRKWRAAHNVTRQHTNAVTNKTLPMLLIHGLRNVVRSRQFLYHSEILSVSIVRGLWRSFVRVWRSLDFCAPELQRWGFTERFFELYGIRSQWTFITIFYRNRRKFSLIESNAKCRYLKKLTWKGLRDMCFNCLRPPLLNDPILYPPPPYTVCVCTVYTVHCTVYLFTQGRRGGRANQREG
jgi:hypothetical protein